MLLIASSIACANGLPTLVRNGAPTLRDVLWVGQFGPWARGGVELWARGPVAGLWAERAVLAL